VPLINRPLQTRRFWHLKKTHDCMYKRRLDTLVMLLMLPHLVRSALFCVCSLIPENTVVGNVAFQSSLQIVVATVYLLCYACGKVLMRVLCSSELVKDPAIDRYDDLDLDALDDHRPVVAAEPPASTWARVQHARRKIKARMQALSSRILLDPGARVGAQDVEGVTRAGSIGATTLSDLEEWDSDEAAANAPDTAAGVRPTPRRPGFERMPIGVVHDQPVYAASKHTLPLTDPRANSTSAAAGDAEAPAPRPAQPVPLEPPSTPAFGPAFYLPFAEPALRGVAGEAGLSAHKERAHAYVEVYGLGFAIFVVFYCIDCASMQPAFCLLVGVTALALRDMVRITDPLLVAHESVETNLVKAISVFSFMLALAAQICVAVGIGRVPSYHAPLRDGSVLRVPAPATMLDVMLAVVFPISAPLLLHFVSKRQNVPRLQSMVRSALPTTMLIALWFLTSLGTMKDELRTTLGVASVNQTLDELFRGDRVQAPVAVLAPFFKIPAVLALVSCCISGKSLDILTSLSLVFFVKQKGLVKEGAMVDMLVVATVFAAFAWTFASLRYWTQLMRWIATQFAL